MKTLFNISIKSLIGRILGSLDLFMKLLYTFNNKEFITTTWEKLMDTNADFKEKTAQVYDLLVEEAGLVNYFMQPEHNQQELDGYRRAEFIINQSLNPAEFWFHSVHSENMRLLYSPFEGFTVYSQSRTVRGITAENRTNRALRAEGLQFRR